MLMLPLLVALPVALLLLVALVLSILLSCRSVLTVVVFVVVIRWLNMRQSFVCVYRSDTVATPSSHSRKSCWRPEAGERKTRTVPIELRHMSGNLSNDVGTTTPDQARCWIDFPPS